MSPSTVSRVLSDTRSGMISEATRQRVIRVAREMNYRPNRAARALRKGRSHILGAIVWYAPGSWDADLLEGIELAATDRQYLLTLGCSWGEPERERQHLEALWEHGIDGLLVFPTQPPANADLYRQQADAGVPVVFAGEAGPIPCDLVETDHQGGGYQVARHLLEQGCRDLVCLRRENLLGIHWCESRLAGFTQALREAGLPEPTVLTPAGVPGQDHGEIRQALEQHLAGGGRMDALFAAHDRLALPALGALAKMGLRVPQEVAIAGFDDLPAAAHSDPPLTSMHQNWRGGGTRAVDLLINRIESSAPAREPVQELVQPTLAPRASTDRKASAVAGGIIPAGPEEVRLEAEAVPGWREAEAGTPLSTFRPLTRQLKSDGPVGQEDPDVSRIV